jgi:hypothetical protein
MDQVPRREPAERGGGGQYVTFLDPRRIGHSPNTVEGYLANLGTFSAGALRAHGWRRLAAKIIVVAVLLPIAATVLWWVWNLLGLLVGA